MREVRHNVGMHRANFLFRLRRHAVMFPLALLPFALGGGCSPGSADNSTGVVTSPVASPSASAPTASVPGPAFNATRAFADLEKQVAFGTRVPGTEGHAKTRDWLLEELNKTAGNAKRQDFTYKVPGGPTLSMSNIVARFNPEAKTQILLCAHWDTRPTADQEIEPDKQNKPIPGANDGASGVAVLLELARKFAAQKPNVGVQIVLFDGEDYGPTGDNMYLGAKHYAKNPAFPKPDYAILLDMIGDRELSFQREAYSDMQAPEINDKVWDAAEALGRKEFLSGVGRQITDDHIPLQEAGIKAIDLIDFDYAPWHTLDDTPDKCSPASLKAIGDVVAKVVYEEK